MSLIWVILPIAETLPLAHRIPQPLQANLHLRLIRIKRWQGAFISCLLLEVTACTRFVVIFISQTSLLSANINLPALIMHVTEVTPE